jgi:hypothetical protein
MKAIELKKELENLNIRHWCIYSESGYYGNNDFLNYKTVKKFLNYDDNEFLYSPETTHPIIRVKVIPYMKNGITIKKFKTLTKNVPEYWIFTGDIVTRPCTVKKILKRLDRPYIKDVFKIGNINIIPSTKENKMNYKNAEDAEIKNKVVSVVGRHPLMEDVETSYYLKKKKEIELDQELGLTNQSLISNMELLKNDIDHLTSSKKYYPVTERMLNQMFRIRKLKNKCLLHNLKEIFDKTWNRLWLFFTSASLTCGSAFLIKYSMIKDLYLWKNVFMSSTIFFGCICTISAFFALFIKGIKIRYQYIQIELMKEPINVTKYKIPYGAKLKMKEALDTKIFKDFIIAYPKVEVRNEEIDVKIRMETDPALLGITDDKREFLICWWDVKHDIDKAEKKIDWIKKFKVETKI